MKPMLARIVFAALLCAAFGPRAAANAAPEVGDLREQVVKLQRKLGTILAHGSELGLPEDLLKDAARVQKDAEGAIAADSEWLERGVLSESVSFMRDLKKRQQELSEENLQKHPEIMVKSMKAQAARLISHLSKARSDGNEEDDKERAAVLKALEAATLSAPANITTAGEDKEAVVEAARGLDDALGQARAYLTKQTSRLDAEEAKLKKDVQGAQVMQLYRLLKLRKVLPLPAQAALLKRPAWKNCTFAAELLHDWEAAQKLEAKGREEPLYKRFEVLANKAGFPVETPKNSTEKDSVKAVPGSEGRVYVVSSRLKNSVKSMAAKIETMKVPLQQYIKEHRAEATEAGNVKQAQEIIKGIDEAIGAVRGTHDFKTQMEAMNAMGDKLEAWMAEAERRNPEYGANEKKKEKSAKVPPLRGGVSPKKR